MGQNIHQMIQLPTVLLDQDFKIFFGFERNKILASFTFFLEKQSL